MGSLFTSIPGTVFVADLAVTAGQVSIPAELADPRLKDPGAPSTVLFGAMEWQQNTHQQFSTSLEGSVYIYVFGDQMGMVKLSGITFDRLCEGGGKPGLAIVLDYYNQNRASQRPAPIQVNVADKTVQGFLTGVSVRTMGVATDKAPVLQEYTMEINALP
jgi:hypothetical protein